MPDTDADVAARIRELEDRRYQAMTGGDLAVLDELLSADLVYTHSDASRDTKQSYLDKIATGFFDYGPLTHPEQAIVVHGDCAIVTGDMRGEVQIAGQARVLNSSALAVWVRENDTWLLLAFQPTKYPALPGAASSPRGA
jgi:ketosteroid isomerase-like protein